jgi:hypothetical protein
MHKTDRQESKFVVCIRRDGSDDLELRKVYQVVADQMAAKEGYLRVIDESGEDYLYPALFFAPVRVPVAAVRELTMPSNRAPRPAVGVHVRPARTRARG